MTCDCVPCQCAMASLAQISNAGATPMSLSGSRCATVCLVRQPPNPSSQATLPQLTCSGLRSNAPERALQLLLARQHVASLLVVDIQTIPASSPNPDLPPAMLYFTLGSPGVKTSVRTGPLIGEFCVSRLHRTMISRASLKLDARHVHHQPRPITSQVLTLAMSFEPSLQPGHTGFHLYRNFRDSDDLR